MATTIRQRLVATKIMENRGNISKTMLQAGYSPKTAKNPKNLTNSRGWQQLMDKFLPDQKLLQVHQELLQNPDWRARNEGLDKAYRIKGRMRSNSIDADERGSYELEAVIMRIRGLLPDSIQ